MENFAFGIAAAAALLVAGSASAQTANVTVQQIGASPEVAVVNFNRSIALGNATVGATALNNNVSVEGRDVNIGGPGWVSANTGIGGQTASANVSAQTNVNLVGFGGKVDIATQAISNNTEVNATGTVNVNNTLSQRTSNADIGAQTNVSLIAVAGKSDIGSVAVVNNLNVDADRVNVGGTSTADLQISRGNDVVANTNVALSAFGGNSSITSQAVSNSASFTGYAVNANTAQTTGLGDPWPVAQTNLALANTNVTGALFGGKASIGSTALQNTLSITGVDVNVNAAQSNYGAATSAITNVSFAGFGGASAISATSVGNSISVKLP